MKVFVLDTNHKPLLPCHAAIARQLLSAGKAAVLRAHPFTIILKHAVDEQPRQLRLKLDPGSKTTGIAIIDDANKRIMFAADLEYRGQKIKHDLEVRRMQRRARRQRKTRYRKSRFLNRRSAIREGLKAPSLLHRVYTVETWVNRFRKYAPIGAISLELVRFDTQKIQNPEISGLEYQRGELMGMELREYLLEKWQHRCAYCSAENVPMQVEHIKAKANGGTDRASNLTLACEKCNTRKGTQPIEKFLAKKPDILKRILAQAKMPLKDAAAVNSTRWAIFEMLKKYEWPIECGTGGRTKYNRIRNGFAKSHWTDAANVGASTPTGIIADQIKPLLIKAIGKGSRQMQRVDKFGFPRSTPKFGSAIHNFRMGDIVRADVRNGKYRGTHFGRLVGIRARGDFDVATGNLKFTTNHRNLTKRQKANGYAFAF